VAAKLETDEIKILWKDRRRRLGMPLSFTRYELGEERLILRKGFFKTETDEIMLYRIMDIHMSRSLGQKIFGVGTIELTSSDKTHPKLELKNIKNPEDVRRFLGKQVESQRAKKGVISNEMVGGRGPGCNHEGENFEI
jgi:uncharacterized membrane protein YdbT with pleckstrin-like domain